MTTAAAQAIPASQADVTMEVPKQDVSGNFYVFFAADLIDGAIKSMNPAWEAGGILRPEAFTLKYRNGYIRKCEITALRPQIISELSSFIQPDERKHLATTIDIHTPDGVVKVGQTLIDRDRRPTAKEGAVSAVHDGLLRTIFYPALEIGRLAGQVDGVVRMPCASGLEAVKAQYFLFPNWDRIVSGQDALPHKISELEAYFVNLRNNAEDTWERSIATAAVKSCTDFRDWGTKDTNSANSTYRAMQQKGFAWPYGERTEMAFSQLGLQRQDTITQEQTDKLDRLTDSIAKFVEVSISNAGAKDTPAAPTADDLTEFFQWKAEQEKARADLAIELNAGDAVMVGPSVATVLNPKADFGRVLVKFAESGIEKSYARHKITPIPEDK